LEGIIHVIVGTDATAGQTALKISHGQSRQLGGPSHGQPLGSEQGNGEFKTNVIQCHASALKKVRRQI
jgi:hypothetical protein